MKNIKYWGFVSLMLSGIFGYAQKIELSAGETLNPGEPVFSKNGKYVLIMENVSGADYGQFATFATNNYSLARDKGIMSSKPICRLGKQTQKAQKLSMQTDGNLALYDYKTSAYLWDAKTHQKTSDAKQKGAKMIVENDGSVSVYDFYGKRIWSKK